MPSVNFECGLEHVEDLRDKSLEIELFLGGVIMKWIFKLQGIKLWGRLVF